MILLFFDRFSPFFPEPGVFTGSHIFFWDRNNVAVISASHVALWGTSFLREDFLNAFYPLVFYIYVDKKCMQIYHHLELLRRLAYFHCTFFP